MNDNRTRSDDGAPGASQVLDNGRPDVALQIEVLEERIAPYGNRCETLVGEKDESSKAQPQPPQQRESQLDVELLEERIAPLMTVNRCETLDGEGGAPGKAGAEKGPTNQIALWLDVEVLEERIAPFFVGRGFALGQQLSTSFTSDKLSLNRCETLVDGDDGPVKAKRRPAEETASQLDVEVLEERIAPLLGGANRCEALFGEPQPRALQLEVELLEERIAPFRPLGNRCETLVGESAEPGKADHQNLPDQSALTLDVELLEERIAPGFHGFNRCETLAGDRRRAR